MAASVEKNAHIWARDPLDWYAEPPSASQALLAVESFAGAILDPACGQGNIVLAARAAGYDAYGSDIRRRCDPNAPWWIGKCDFLAEDHPINGNIVMNPPFFRAAGAEGFIRKALALASGKVCAFVDVRFISGAKRAEGLFLEHPPARIWIVTPRPSCPPGEYLRAGGKAEGGSADYCWLVWDQAAPTAPGETQTGWIRRGA